MQDKFEYEFDRLPPEMQLEVVNYLPTPDLEVVTKTHLSDAPSLFQPKLNIREFLRHVVSGKHEVVKAMLEKDINLLCIKGRVTDCSKRTFYNISGFEYALWALDKHQWTMMLDCLPKNEAGQAVLKKLRIQYAKVKREGVTYELNDNKFTEKHFDFENTIIKELQTQVDSLNAPGIKDWHAIHKQWREGVGGAQNLFPMHVVYEYCFNRPFYPLPDFTQKPPECSKFYNWSTRKDENWFATDSKLGIDFAIYKGAAAAWSTDELDPPLHAAPARDLQAMMELFEARTKNFICLESYLETDVACDMLHNLTQI